MKSKGILIGRIVALVIAYTLKITTTCSPMIGHLRDANIVISLVKRSIV